MFHFNNSVSSKTNATLLSIQQPLFKKLMGSSKSHSPHGTRDFVQWACIGHQPGSSWLVNAHYGNKVFIGAIQQKGRKSKPKTTYSVPDHCWMISQTQWCGTKWQLKSWFLCNKKKQWDWFPYYIYMKKKHCRDCEDPGERKSRRQKPYCISNPTEAKEERELVVQQFGICYCNPSWIFNHKNY